MSKILALSLALLCLTSPRLPGQSLEDRIATLEAKMDEVLRLLGERPAGSPETAPADETKSSGATGAAPAKPSGKLKTQLRNGAKLLAYRVTEDSFETLQDGDPLETGHDVGDSFRIANYLSTPSAKTFTLLQIGARWSGFLWIEEPGKYTFTGECKTAVSSNGGVAKAFINGQSLLTATTRNKAPELGEMEFTERGMYLFEVWVAPRSASRNGAHNNVALEVQIRRQGAESFKKLTPGSLYSEK